MSTAEFGLVLLLVGGAGLLSLLAYRLTTVVKVPAPAFLFVAAAVAAHLSDPLRAPNPHTVEQVVTVALVFILFDGGLHLGWRRLRPALLPVVSLGVLGTALCAAGFAAFLFLLTNVSWYQAVLVGMAVAPTDPAVVFSVFGNREVDGLGGTILEGESGANDPIGIALLASLLGAGGLGGHAVGAATGEFALQMGVGAAFGIIGAAAIAVLSRRRLPFPALDSLRSIACVLVVFGAATWGHGSGFLAVFVAGIALGDVTFHQGEQTGQVHEVLSSVGEVVSFIVLGLTVDFGVLGRTDVWLPGLALALAGSLLIRPVLAAPCLWRSSLSYRERLFVLLCGLKGAVPILLGLSLIARHAPGGDRLYGIVVVVVLFSVVVQGTAVPLIARMLRIPLRPIAAAPPVALASRT